MLAPIIWNDVLKSISMYFPNLEELSFRVVFAFPMASMIGDDARTLLKVNFLKFSFDKIFIIDLAGLLYKHVESEMGFLPFFQLMCFHIKNNNIRTYQIFKLQNSKTLQSESTNILRKI